MAQILSDTPGRLRLRLRPERRHGAFMRRVHDRLTGRKGIEQVSSNVGTGSVTITYDPRHHGAKDVLALLRDLGVVAETVVRSSEEAELPDLDHSTTASSIVSTLDDLDNRIAQFTGYRVDLKLIFPLALGALGVVQLARNGVDLGEVPGYVLIWYAFDSFFKLHMQSGREVGSRTQEADPPLPNGTMTRA